MSGFGFGGGFGQNNQQQQQSTGFGGFGQTTNTANTGFGAPASTGFGATQNTGGGLFGASTGGGFGNTGGFGSSTGAFGAPAAKPAFGATGTTSSLFGGGSTTSAPAFGGGGGFGSNTASTGFGANTNTGGGLFGAAKPATTGFGAPASTGFGQAATTSAFGGSTGFGATPTASAECTGTASVAYQPHTEKEGTQNQQVKYENICCQAPYQKFSQEELRLADYNAGRRYASGGQAGAFGQSTGFGGFGQTQSTTPAFGATPAATGGGLFGNTQSNTTSNPFGQTSTANTGFGSTNNTTGGLFGSAAKPASTGLFGAPASTGFGAQPASTGFGAQPASTGFGSNTGTTSSLFGNNSTTQNKGLFGAAPAATTSAFGSNTGTTGFGSQPASSPFGQTQQQPAAPNPFGAPAATQQPATSSPFGSGAFGQQQNNNTTTSGGLFGAAKPATTGLFGNTSTSAPATGGGLFGNASSTPATGGFGQAAAAPASGGLFGAKAAAPATGGLFGGTNTQQNTTGTSGGLFGGGFGQNQNQQQQQQPSTGGGLFGGLGQQQNNTNTSGGLFGAAKPATTNLFGNTNQQQNNTGTTGGLFGGGSTFGNTQNQPQQQNSGGSLFGGSSLFGGGQQNQNQNQQQQQPQQQQNGSFTTSINDPTAFGNTMFSQLATPDQGNPGPLATPLSSLSKQKKAGVIPLYKLNPASGSRIGTPQKRGFGFSYSTYGTPNAMSSVTSTPGGYGQSMLGHSLGSTKLIKSTSTSGLRNSYNSSFSREDSILAPGAFSQSPSSRYNSSSGSMKRLVIDRGIRGDLFTPPAKKGDNGILKKRVSFEANAPAGNGNGSAANPSPLKQVTTNGEADAQENGFLRSSTRSADGDVAKTVETPEMEQVKGNELAIVPEESSPSQAASPFNHKDQQPGDYWMKPSKEEIMAMNRTQRQKISNFSVGRQGVGAVHFDMPVDLSNIDLDNFFDKIVILEVRSATVYPDATIKPPMGQGLNVPSTIELENSWPRHDKRRSMGGDSAKQLMSKHARRLQKVTNTEFVNYDEKRGIWTFKVPHFTTYGLNYDSDEDDEMAQDDMEQDIPQTPAYEDATPRASHESSFISQSGGSGYTESELEDDTFDFKKRKIFPGAFDRSAAIEDDEEMREDYHEMSERRQSFLDERSAGSMSPDDVDEPMDHDVSQGNELVRVESNEMAGSFPQLDATVELQRQNAGDDEEMRMPPTPGGILRARMRLEQGTPLKKKVMFADDNEDWATMLQQTVSPQKRDRAELKRIRDDETEAEFSGSPSKMTAKNRVVSDGRGFATSIDLMHSLFGETKSPMKARAAAKPKSSGFEWPYNKKSKDAGENLNKKERAYHDSVKPSWGPNGTLLYQPPTDAEFPTDQLIQHSALLTARDNVGDIRLSKIKDDAKPAFLSYQKQIAAVQIKDDVPQAELSLPFSFKDFINDNDPQDPALIHEKLVWELASILFDEIAIPDDLKNFPAAFKFLRKDLLSAFWEKLVDPASVSQISIAQNSEEKAVAALAGHKIADACRELLSGKNFHLATLVALLDGNEDVRESITEQLSIWRDSRALSEINQPIRAIYDILAGNVCVCEGSKKGAPIEDRIDTFVISKHFGLDWRQAFGLRLWYAISNTDELKSAVSKFSEDLAHDKEDSKPIAWYVEQSVSPLWDDQHMEHREDLLWGLLKLYSSDKTDLQAVIRPENSQLSPLDTRLTWQLSQALTASGKAAYGSFADEKADALTLSYASQLTNGGHWLDAMFVLLHLSQAAARAKAIQDLLALNAGKIGTQESETFTTLVEKYKIPAAWIWSAKALYMRAVAKDAKKEVDCLIHAEAYDEAHRTLCHDVAPNAIIERDYETLEALLAGFKGKQISVADWELGGGVYGDYLKLVKQQGLGKANASAVQLAERLVTSLPAMVGSARSVGFLQRVAAQEMSGVVAEVLAEYGRAELLNGKALDHSKILRLPMTEDRYLKHTADLSLDYYRTVLTGMAR